MSTARIGRDREHRVSRDMVTNGWRQVNRSAASKGSCDLVMVHAIHGFALVQVGSRTKRLGPADRARLIADATDGGALAVLAIVEPRQPIRYWTVTEGTAATWQEWKP